MDDSSLYQAGQEFAQDIVTKAQEIFQVLKISHLPNGTIPHRRTTQDKLNKMKDMLERIEVHFKQLRMIYAECQKRGAVANPDKNLLVPYQDPGTKADEGVKSRQISPKEQMLMNQKSELERQLRMRNAVIDELVSRMKNLIQTINSVWIANQM